MRKLVAAMSGGVDSSVAAAILKEQGYDVVGVTLKMRPCENQPEKRKACCGVDDDLHARSAAERLGIPHYFLNVQEKFEKLVLRRAWDEYSRGRTPNPCALCNMHLKFGALLDFAVESGAEGIITGHYAKIARDAAGRPFIMRGEDSSKDQSYFLFGLTPEQIGKSHMPLGGLRKTKVREEARRLGLPNAGKTESQDACFGYRHETFAQTLGNLFKAKPKAGFIRDTEGNILGGHGGIHLFTIGQRKGLGIALGAPAFVVDINPETGDVTVSKKESDLLSSSLAASEMNWQIPEFAGREFECLAQIRYRAKAAPARVVPESDGAVKVSFEKPQRAVTPGQAFVLYDGIRLIGGGWITRSAADV